MVESFWWGFLLGFLANDIPRRYIKRFLADRNRNGSEKVFGGAESFWWSCGFLAVRKVFGLTETERVSEGFWRLGVFVGVFGVFGGNFGLKYGKNASKSVVFGNSCN
jgi:hypothetical protein